MIYMAWRIASRLWHKPHPITGERSEHLIWGILAFCFTSREFRSAFVLVARMPTPRGPSVRVSRKIMPQMQISCLKCGIMWDKINQLLI